jgi:tetratricopeptide (TPR) repeat protein
MGEVMKKVFFILMVPFIFIITAILPLSADDVSAQTCKKIIAQVVSVQGDVQVRKAGETQWLPVMQNDAYCPGDMIRVMEQSRAAILLATGGIIRLDEKTTVTFNGIEKERTSLIEFIQGIGHFFSRWPRSLTIFTPFVNGTVEGTEFLVKVDNDKTFISIFEGKVEASNKAGSLTLTSGQSATAKKDQPPALQILVRPRDAVQWALYYPPVLYPCPDKLKSDDPRSYICKASSLLHVGRINEAKAYIEKALKRDPKNSQAFALQSVIAVVQNDKEKALSLAKKAVEADPKSASAYIALSYAQQTQFDLKDALESLQKAVNAEPENALAWARLSELWLSFGNLDEALKAANKAVELNPNIARTHTVLGFAYLTQVKIKESMAASEKAIELDQAAPLPRLGLGLAKIRKGCLEEGRKEIEIAVSLDPDNSLIRSYLGKAYYEEKQDKMAQDQYGMAKDFDPKDPTPFFYDAIRKQSINRPVEALHDMEQAIELNDNRAVYRSQLLLDSDLAARSASLARIYNDLGFEDLALVEGWKSVNTDPADYSAHRFLSDSYSVLPRHEIARVSELLQSQLLQPININPVQPHLEESDLSILQGAGPSDLSFNEFNPLFNRNRYSLQVSGIAGENSTFGEEIVVAAVQGKVSLSAGQFHYETDGWRENNDQKQDIYNLFAQVELSPKTSVQAEFRAKDFNRGDLTLFFGKDNFIPTFREEDQERTLRFGFHHAFSPGSDLLGSFIYNHLDLSAHYNPDEPILKRVGIKTNNEEDYSAELQHLFSSKYIKLISGIGYFDINRKDVFTLEMLIPEGPPFPIKVTDISDFDTSHTNLYVYSQINYPKTVTFTIGGSVDFYDGSETNTNQFNPKFGVIWNPLPATTLRAAAFRTLKRTLSTNQTLEPTQVAGFNQFFDDNDATDAWNYGIAVDQKFSKTIYGGAEYSQRDLEYPAFVLPRDPEAALELQHLKGKERLGRAYLYWTPHKWIALSAEYQYEKTEMDKKDLGVFEFLRTNRFPFAISFSHPSGFSMRVKTTYIDQEGKFKPQGSPIGYVVSGADNFWIVDASVSYRLPKRLGIIMIDARNLFDKFFNYQDIDIANPSIQPKRAVFAKFTLAF